MFRSLTQTIFILIAVGLLMTMDCRTERAQGFSGASVNSNSEKRPDKDLSDIYELVRESDTHGALMHKRLGDYTYTLIKIKRKLNEHGKAIRERVQSFEAFPVQGQHVLVQITENGSALTAREVAEQRRRAGEALVYAEREAQKHKDDVQVVTDDSGRYLRVAVVVNSGGKFSDVLIDLSAFLRSCEFSAPRHEKIGTREAIALSFRPRAGIKLPDQMSFISKLSGTIWIDIADKVVTRLEGWPLSRPAQGDKAAHEGQTSSQSEAQAVKQSEAAIIYQQVRLPTGVWVPSLIRMNAGGDAALFNGLNWDVMFQYSDYKRFSTDVGGIEFEKPKDKP
jgi:hypothetical protein